MHLLSRGIYPPYDPNDMGQTYQLHVNVERVRVPEVLFEPSIIGLDQAGLVETINDIVRTFDNNQREKITKVSKVLSFTRLFSNIFSSEYILDGWFYSTSRSW
jgi:hypothetical protein